MNEKTIIITEYIESHCPYCRYVETSILYDIVARSDDISKNLVKKGYRPLPILEIKLVDVDANSGTKEMQWFEQYSHKVGGIYTPAVRVGDSGKVYYLWGKQKEETPSSSALSSTDKLRKDIILEIEDIITRLDRKPRLYDEFHYNPTQRLQTPRIPVVHTPSGGFTWHDSSF
jgi:hypothetical protein